MSANALQRCIAESVTEEDFYLETMRILWTALSWFSANSIPVDLVAIAEHLKSIGLAFPPSELADISTRVENIFIRNIDLHIATLKSYTKKRRLNDFANNLTQNIESYLKEPDAAVMELQTQVTQLTIANGRKKRRSSMEIAESALKLLHNRISGVFNGVHTGIKSLDRLLDGGLTNGSLTVIGARPGVGKSVLCAQIAANVGIQQKKNVVVASYEMKSEAYIWRIASGRTSENWKYPTETSIPILTNAIAEISRSGVQVWDDSTMNAVQMQIELEQLRQVQPLDLLIVDFIQRMPAHVRYANRKDLEIGEISMKLKDIAMKFDIPVLAVSSLNRKTEERQNKRPLLSDLRESGSIESDADVVLGLYRPDEEKIDGTTKPSDTLIEINVLKARDGAAGTITLGFNGEFSQVWDIDTEPNLHYAAPQIEGGIPF